MSAQIIPFPAEESNRRLVERWLYHEMKSVGQGEAEARKWSREMRNHVRTLPEDLERMRADLRC